MYAVFYGHLNVVIALLESKANIYRLSVGNTCHNAAGLVASHVAIGIVFSISGVNLL